MFIQSLSGVKCGRNGPSELRGTASRFQSFELEPALIWIARAAPFASGVTNARSVLARARFVTSGFPLVTQAPWKLVLSASNKSGQWCCTAALREECAGLSCESAVHVICRGEPSGV
jgi:hypothetical protein